MSKTFFLITLARSHQTVSWRTSERVQPELYCFRDSSFFFHASIVLDKMSKGPLLDSKLKCRNDRNVGDIVTA